MFFSITLALLLAESTFAIPQSPSKGSGSPAKGSPKGSGSSQGGMAGLATMMGLNPKDGITSMVCQSFDGKNAMGGLIGSMFGSPNGNGPEEQCQVDKSGGSGKYKANYTEVQIDGVGHTIYAPIQPPAEPMPVIIWGNGFCMAAGTMFANFLNEIASHGFFIVANGPVEPDLSRQTNYKELIKAIDWVSGPEAAKYGKLDISQLAVSGQSCGGLEAYSAATDKRIKHTLIFNSGVIIGNSKNQMSKITSKVAYFLGGAKDIAQRNGDADYAYLTAPALKASAEIGHIGTYYQKYGGKMGRAAVAYAKWQLKGDQSFKSTFCNPGPETTLIKDGFKVESKNGMC